MGMLEDVLKALERIPLWKRVSVLPEQVAALEERVRALEAKLAGAGGGALCPICEQAAFRRTSSKPHPVMGGLGVLEDTYTCGACNHVEQRTRGA